jgi:hypothetical protein
MHKEDAVIKELFTLDDIKSGLSQITDLGRLVTLELTNVLDSLVSTFRVFTSIRLSTTVNRIEKFYQRKAKRDREVEASLRQLGAYDFNPDLLFISPAAFTLGLPVTILRNLFDEAGADEVPAWLKRSMSSIEASGEKVANADKPEGLLQKLEKIFFITAGTDKIGELIAEAAALSKRDQQAAELLGLDDLEKQRAQYFADMNIALDAVAKELKQRKEMFDSLKQVDTLGDLKDIFNDMADAGLEFDTNKITSAIQKLSAEKDQAEIKQAISSSIQQITSGFGRDLKNDVMKKLEGFPEIEMLEKSDSKFAKVAVELMKDINDLLAKF